MIWNAAAPFIPNDIIAELWGNGFTKTKALNDVDNIGAYFSAYLADLPVDELDKMDAETVGIICATCPIEEKSFVHEDETIKDKKFVKGARLYLYPPGMNLYRKSQGIKEPMEYPIPVTDYLDIITTYERHEKKASLGELTFSSASSLVGDDGRLINHINRYYFNTKHHELNGDAKK